ncbi:MAG: SRPBCC family protein [Thaumarchaeota archaeon]|nr:SRPBCC family protein [Nitrososphaerota archaeon]
MVALEANREINAPIENVWKVVSDVDTDPNYWSGLSSIRNLRKEGNVIEREVVVGFLNHRAKQTITLHPKQSVELSMSKGPMIGKSVMSLISVSGAAKTRLDVKWMGLNYHPIV